MFQLLLGIPHLLVVDIDFWCALGKHGEVAITALHLWQHRQHIVSRADIFQQRVLNIDGHAARGHLVLRTIAFHYDLAQRLCVGLHLNVTNIALPCVYIHCYISYARHFQQTVLFVGADAECSIFLGHGSRNEGGVGTVDEYNVDKWHRQRLFINDTSSHILCRCQSRCCQHGQQEQVSSVMFLIFHISYFDILNPSLAEGVLPL